MAHEFEGKKIFEIKNVSGGRAVIGGLSIPSGESKVIEPHKYSTGALDKMNAFILRGFLQVNYDVKIEEEKEEVLNVEHVKGEETSKDAVVYNPEKEFRKKAIEVSAIETGKAIEVSENNTESKAVAVEENSVTFDAKDFLELHWKKIEAELKDMGNREELRHILKVANQLEVKGKKLELIEERLGELE